MIDTTGWKIKVSPEQVQKILKRSKEFSGYDHETETTTFRILKDNLYIGSHNSNITIKCYETNQVYIEFSVPKQFYGHNVYLLYPSQLEQALVGVHRNLVDRFSDFPHYRNWYLMRLDLCYSWKYDSQDSAEQMLSILKNFDYPRKNKYLYKDSVMWRGKTSSIKFYLKHNEFIKHDYKKLIKLDKNEFANKLLHLSEGVLRYEITLRKQSLDYIFSKKLVTYKDLLNKSFLENILNKDLNILTMNLDKNIIVDREIIKRLKTIYNKQKTIHLFSFYKLFNSQQLNSRQILKHHFHPSTIWRNKRDLAKAKVGLQNINKNQISVKLDIPSEIVVNPDPSCSSAS